MSRAIPRMDGGVSTGIGQWRSIQDNVSSSNIMLLEPKVIQESANVKIGTECGMRLNFVAQ